MKNIDQLFKQVQRMQAEMEKLQASLENERVEGTSGGGMVLAVLNGKREILELKIDPEVVKPDDVEMLEELICAAINQAQQRAVELQTQGMSKLTGGLPMPGMGF